MRREGAETITARLSSSCKSRFCYHYTKQEGAQKGGSKESQKGAVRTLKLYANLLGVNNGGKYNTGTEEKGGTHNRPPAARRTTAKKALRRPQTAGSGERGFAAAVGSGGGRPGEKGRV
jgi:hypothetical protein